MLADSQAFSSFSVNDLEAAKAFYGGTLGLEVSAPMDQVQLALPGGGRVFVYSKPDHVPATFTVLNFVVADVKQTVAELRQHGVTFEQYPQLKTDADGIARDERGPAIAWFKDPAGNIIAVLELPAS